MNLLDLSDKIILITGGCGAIGRVVVKTLADHGATVAVNDIVPAETAAQILQESGASGPKVAYFQADATDPVTVNRLFDDVTAHLGLPNVVCCHAGMVEAFPVDQYPVEQFDQLMQLNVRASFIVAQTASQRWIASNTPGHLLFTASWVADVPWPEITPYTASKAAVKQMARGFPRELVTKNIRANIVAPGIVAVGLAKRQWDTDPSYRSRRQSDSVGLHAAARNHRSRLSLPLFAHGRLYDRLGAAGGWWVQFVSDGLSSAMQIDTDNLIRNLILEQRQATEPEITQIITHVAQQAVSSALRKMNLWLREELDILGIQTPPGKLPSAQLQLFKRIYYDGQWPLNTTVSQFEADLHKAVQHPEVQLWTYQWFGENFAGFLAPSHIHNVPNPEQFIFVAYVADYGKIKTGFQASGIDKIFTDEFALIVRHK